MSQSARLKEDLITNPIKSSTKIVPKGSRLCYSLYQNLLSINHVKDELARDLSSIKSSHLGSTSSAPSRNFTSSPALISALISAPIPAPASALPFSDKLFR